MESGYSTFNNSKIDDLQNIEAIYNVRLARVKHSVTFQNVQETVCNCIFQNENRYDITNFNSCEEDMCAICRSESTDQFVKSSCDHAFHYSCIVKWLKFREICPLCSATWKLVDEPIETILHFEGKVYDSSFEYDKTKYGIAKNKYFVKEVKKGHYGICSLDSHETDPLKINCIYGCDSKELIVKNYKSLSELKESISVLWNLFKEEVSLKHNDLELVSDFDTLNLYNLNIKNGDTVIVTKTRQEYQIDITNNFVVLYVDSSSAISWLPYIGNNSRTDLSCLLSSLYLLDKKVNNDSKLINLVISNFEGYLSLYKIDPFQSTLATEALKCYLTHNIKNYQKIILSTTIYELVFKMSQKNLYQSNVLMNLLISIEQPQLINWKYMKPLDFTIYNPLALTKGVAPLLTMNEELEIVVYVGQGKDLSFPVILYNPLTKEENHVNAAELGKKVSGSLEINDDRVYQEAIMICVDVSNSMDKCSDFAEDLQAKANDEKEYEDKFYAITKIERKRAPDPEDIRKLKDAMSWFISHPNFNDWKKRFLILEDIILLEQHTNPEIALMISRYIKLFDKILNDQSVLIDSTKYSTKRHYIPKQELKFKTDPPNEFICPISHKIMEDPVIAQDGFSYERKSILNWFSKNIRSPITNEVIDSGVFSNNNLKILINEWIEQNRLDQEPNFIKVIYEDCSYLVKADNIWDLYYQVYLIAGLSHDTYNLTYENGFKIDQRIPDIVKVSPKKINLIELKIYKGFSNSFKTLWIPDNSKLNNIIYSYNEHKYHLCQLWKNLKFDGDNVNKGQLLEQQYVDLDNKEDKFHILYNARYRDSKTYLTRLDVVKRLFDSFINRSIAYNFDNAIGLISFSNEARLQCDLCPYYESFRDHINELTTSGDTALYQSLKEALTRLTLWKHAHVNRNNAKLRIICLSDGLDNKTNFISDIKKLIRTSGVILDCIFIGDEYDYGLISLSKETNGYVFNPKSIKSALDIMELETIVSSVNRSPARFNNFNVEPQMIDLENSIIPTYESKKAILKQLSLISCDTHPDILIDYSDNLYVWKVTMKGPQGTLYSSGTWTLKIQFTGQYPFEPPHVRFMTPIKHCNINSYGRVCHSILTRNYNSSVRISTILECIYGLLLNPDVSDPLDTNLAMLYYEANGQYEAQILEHTMLYATKQ